MPALMIGSMAVATRYGLKAGERFALAVSNST
jgi:hypothetical protein